MNDILSRLFFAGFIRLHILHHAADEPICGVDIVAELGRHGYRLSPGTVYPALHELEKAGYLTVRPSVVGGKARKYYAATKLGRRALKQARTKLHELASEVLQSSNPRQSPKRKR
ncbi:MAG: helix-turn-helix transcriptional regulator [Planctomycetes bacterium]|nr:helix-turn-helix transcriptional regulator [Planctomycetota bacterium]